MRSPLHATIRASHHGAGDIMLQGATSCCLSAELDLRIYILWFLNREAASFTLPLVYHAAAGSLNLLDFYYACSVAQYMTATQFSQK